MKTADGIPNPAWEIFGDESAQNSAVTYGLVMVPAKRAAEVNTALNELKVRYGAPEQARIHCRLLFAGSKRKKSEWAHLEPEHVFNLCWDVAHVSASAGASFRVGYVDTRDLPPDLLFVGRLPKTPAKEKQLLSFAYAAALIGLEKNPGIDAIRLWQDPDPSRIQWGGKKRQAGRHPLTLEGRELKPQVISGPKPMLLDVADVLAYCSAHSLSAEHRHDKARFREIYSRFGPELIKFEFHEQAFKVPQPVGI